MLTTGQKKIPVNEKNKLCLANTSEGETKMNIDHNCCIVKVKDIRLIVLSDDIGHWIRSGKMRHRSAPV